MEKTLKNWHHILNGKLSKEQKKIIEKAVKKTLKEYDRTMTMLGNS